MPLNNIGLIMQTRIDKTADASKEVKSPFDTAELDFNLSNIKTNAILEWNGITIGKVVIKGELFYVKLDDNAPTLVISDFPPQKKILIEAANAVQIKQGLSPSLETLVIEAGSIDYRANSSASKIISLMAKGALLISGSLDSEEIYCDAASVTNVNKLKGKELLSIRADEIDHKGELVSNTLLLNAHAIDMDEQSKVNVQKSLVITAHSILLNGTLKASSKVKENPLREITASKIIVDKGARLKLNKTDISGAEIQSHGDVSLEECNFAMKHLDFHGNYSINNSRLFVEKSVVLSGDNRSTLSNSNVEAEHLVFSGENNINDTKFISDDILFSEGNNSGLINCYFDVKK